MARGPVKGMDATKAMATEMGLATGLLGTKTPTMQQNKMATPNEVQAARTFSCK